VLALFDALLSGFRAAAGRDGRIAKRAYYRVAIGRGALAGVAVVAANVALAAVLVTTAPEPAAAWRDLLRAGGHCVLVFGTFATVTLIALGFWFAPVMELRLVPTLLVLGPLTLIRPVVLVGGLVSAAIRVPTPRVWVAALAAGSSMLAIERWLGRGPAQRWRRLV
jgi:hypothetical protein